MYRSTARALLLALAALLAVAFGHAAPRDTAANQKIEEAINAHYLGTAFDKAEALLKGVIDACEDRCSPSVKARAWMYVGIVRGSGRQNIAGAQESFQQALALDPNVKLDDALSTPAVRQAFTAAAAVLGQTAPAAGPKQKAPALASGGGEVPGNMECTPDVQEVETQRPIPVACTTDEPAVRVALRYKTSGGEQWQQVAMVKKGETWQGEIPCADTGASGKVKFYVLAKDRDGEELDTFGTKKQPATIAIVSKSDEEPPSYPGQPPPQRCMSKSECPEDMIGTPACPGSASPGQRGNKGWGVACDTSTECEVGLLCTQGDAGRTCETAPTCETPSDCPADAVCKNGTCDVKDEGGSAVSNYKKNWLGLHFGVDFAFMSGRNVCGPNTEFDCFYAGGIPANFAAPTFAGTIGGGAAAGTLRVMGSYERLLSSNIGVEGRLGFAFNGGPKSGGSAFLPIHVEARGKFWFLKDSFSRRGLRPYVALGGGVAEVDAKLTVRIIDCTDSSPEALAARIKRPIAECLQNPGGADYPKPTVDAYRKLGLGFVTVGGGVMYALAPRHGFLLNLNLMFMVPASGMVLEPSVGYEFGL